MEKRGKIPMKIEAEKDWRLSQAHHNGGEKRRIGGDESAGREGQLRANWNRRRVDQCPPAAEAKNGSEWYRENR